MLCICILLVLVKPQSLRRAIEKDQPPLGVRLQHAQQNRVKGYTTHARQIRIARIEMVVYSPTLYFMSVCGAR